VVCDEHFIAAMTSGQLSGSRYQQTLKRRHQISLSTRPNTALQQLLRCRAREKPSRPRMPRSVPPFGNRLVRGEDIGYDKLGRG
jgi:hypothetical protein